MTQHSDAPATRRPDPDPRHGLSGRDRKQLRARAHGLKPLVQIGQNGLSDTALAEIELGLDKHELIKVRLSSDRDERQLEQTSIVDRTGAAVIGSIGRVVILFRPRPAG